MTFRTLPILALMSACASPVVDQEPIPLTGSTIVSLTFDDTLADQYQVGAMLAQRGLVGTFYVNSPRLAQSGYMSLNQVLTLQQQGNEIGGHTLDHVDLTTLSDADIKHEICDDRNALLGLGLRVTSFAYPFSADNDTVRAITKDCNYNSGRDNGSLMSRSCDNCPYANPIPPTDPYSIKTNSSVASTDTLDYLQSWVIGAEQHGGGWVPITFHHVCDGCSSNGISPALLAQFLDWLAARASRGTQVATVDQVIGGDVKPPVPTSSEPPPDTSGNLLKNPSLETDANGDQIPDCWYRGGSGTNSATFTLTSNAADGRVAQRIDMTSFTSGARRLVSMQDSGFCAPSVTPGRTYTVKASYIANTSPIFSIYYRDTAGTWKWLAQSSSLGTSSSYVSRQYTTPPMPSDATAISVGLAITNVGYIIMDNYSLLQDPLPPPPDPSNLAPNPSLETDANSDQVPDCWYRGGSGTNSATFTLTSNAADGKVAQRIDMTSFTDGARRLVIKQDSGACAPAAKPGRTYTMRAKYIANIAPIFSVYYRDTSGTWKWYAQSPRLPTSSTYADAVYTSPALPADATAISVGLAITGVGYIIMDAYSLVEN